MERIGIYPGTFDPFTHGHMDILKQSLSLFDRVVVLVAYNRQKTPCFHWEKRVELLQDAIAELPPEQQKRVDVQADSGLLIRFAQKHNACAVIRGLRAVSDFEYEFQLAGMNRNLNQDIIHVSLMATNEQQFISSTFVREVASLGGDVSSFVCPSVNQALIERYSGEQ